MTNKKNNKTMKEKTTLSACIPAGKPVLDYLKEKSGERHTKLEAYCDLLDKVSAGYVSDALKKLDVELQPGQSAVTITDLAGCWHWHRATVRSFLKGLEDLGQIRKSSLTRSYIITMAAPDSVGDGTGNGKGNAGDVLADRLDALLYEWVSGRLSDVECGKACQRLANAGTAVFADQNQDSIPDKGKAAHAESVWQSWNAWPLLQSAVSCRSTDPVRPVLWPTFSMKSLRKTGRWCPRRWKRLRSW